MQQRSFNFGAAPLPDHDGETYSRELDLDRLNQQARRVYDVIEHGQWWTLREIAALTGDPEASISARLRDLRKPRFGGFRVERRRRGVPSAGLWEYRLLLPG